MDLLSWINSNPTCKSKLTRRKYYDRFLFRVKIYAPFCRLLRGTYVDDPKTPLWNQIAANVDHRKERQRLQLTHYISSYWNDRLIHDSDNCDVDQLEYLYKKIKTLGNAVKIRVEEPYVEIYAENQMTILDIIESMPLRSNRVMEIHWPGSAVQLEALERGEIIMPKITDYEYQVNLRTILLSNAKRTQVFEYLNGLGDLVKMTPGLKDALTRPKWAHSDVMWIYQCYFYTNDTSVCTFLNLIEPNLINKILKIARLDH